MWRWAAMIWMVSGMGAMAQVIEDFGAGSETRWRYIEDGVMGGVSSGDAQIENGELRLTGEVSTDNNGGFIQVRREVAGLSGEALVLRVRGNGERYTIFLRTRDAWLPWHNYKASFEADADWRDVRLPFAAFERSNRVLPERLDPAEIKSIGIAGYGADYTADVTVDWLRTE